MENFTLYNYGAEAFTSITIEVGDMSGGGYTWAIGSNGGGNDYDIAVTDTPIELFDSLAASSSKTFGLQFNAPGEILDVNEKTATVTITGTQADSDEFSVTMTITATGEICGSGGTGYTFDAGFIAITFKPMINPGPFLMF